MICFLHKALGFRQGQSVSRTHHTLQARLSSQIHAFFWSIHFCGTTELDLRHKERRKITPLFVFFLFSETNHTQCNRSWSTKGDPIPRPWLFPFFALLPILSVPSQVKLQITWQPPESLETCEKEARFQRRKRMVTPWLTLLSEFSQQPWQESTEDCISLSSTKQQNTKLNSAELVLPPSRKKCKHHCAYMKYCSCSSTRLQTPNPLETSFLSFRPSPPFSLAFALWISRSIKIVDV